MRVSKPPDERRAELIKAARRLFDLNGVEATRISDIVGEVGVAQGVFYYYFKSKDEMVAVVTRQVTDEVEQRADALLADGGLTFCEKLAGLIELFIGLVDQFLGDEETKLSLADVTGEDAAGKARALLTERLLALVEAGAAAGQVTAPLPRESALVLLLGLHALAARQLPSRGAIYAITEQGLGIERGALTALVAE